MFLSWFCHALIKIDPHTKSPVVSGESWTRQVGIPKWLIYIYMSDLMGNTLPSKHCRIEKELKTWTLGSRTATKLFCPPSSLPPFCSLCLLVPTVASFSSVLLSFSEAEPHSTCHYLPLQSSKACAIFVEEFVSSSGPKSLMLSISGLKTNTVFSPFGHWRLQIQILKGRYIGFGL